MICRGPGGGGTKHEHSTLADCKRCWGVTGGYTLSEPSATPTAPATGTPAGPLAPLGTYGRPTHKMVNYVGILGGDKAHAATLTFKECGDYIDRLKKGYRPVTSPSRYETKVPVALFKEVPPGYYAVRGDESEPWTFMRISRPKTGRYAGNTKVQTQHGPALSGPKFVMFSDGKCHVYERSIEDPILLLICDWRGAAMRYSQEIGRCCRCNAELTDARSRHYGIGPECEKDWPWVIEMVNDRDALKEAGS